MELKRRITNLRRHYVYLRMFATFSSLCMWLILGVPLFIWVMLRARTGRLDMASGGLGLGFLAFGAIVAGLFFWGMYQIYIMFSLRRKGMSAHADRIIYPKLYRMNSGFGERLGVRAPIIFVTQHSLRVRVVCPMVGPAYYVIPHAVARGDNSDELQAVLSQIYSEIITGYARLVPYATIGSGIFYRVQKSGKDVTTDLTHGATMRNSSGALRWVPEVVEFTVIAWLLSPFFSWIWRYVAARLHHDELDQIARIICTDQVIYEKGMAKLLERQNNQPLLMRG